MAWINLGAAALLFLGAARAPRPWKQYLFGMALGPTLAGVFWLTGVCTV